MELPDVYYGAVTRQTVDWRSEQDRYDSADDDEQLSKTPRSVVEILGFDPLDFEAPSGGQR